jgi:hypothetical protein
MPVDGLGDPDSTTCAPELLHAGFGEKKPGLRGRGSHPAWAGGRFGPESSDEDLAATSAAALMQHQ